jgi:hypothetical protein
MAKKNLLIRSPSNTIDKRITASEKKFTTAEKALLETIVDVQGKCSHDEIVEGEYRKGEYLGSQPPFSVCISCGYAEQGWGCGYTYLKEEIGEGRLTIDRDEARKYVRGRIMSNDTHFPTGGNNYNSFKDFLKENQKP